MIGAAAFLLSWAALKRLPVHGRQKRIDFLGAALLLPAIVALLLVTTWATKPKSKRPPGTGLTGGGACLTLPCFLGQAYLGRTRTFTTIFAGR